MDDRADNSTHTPAHTNDISRCLRSDYLPILPFPTKSPRLWVLSAREGPAGQVLWPVVTRGMGPPLPFRSPQPLRRGCATPAPRPAARRVYESAAPPPPPTQPHGAPRTRHHTLLSGRASAAAGAHGAGSSSSPPLIHSSRRISPFTHNTLSPPSAAGRGGEGEGCRPSSAPPPMTHRPAAPAALLDPNAPTHTVPSPAAKTATVYQN